MSKLSILASALLFTTANLAAAASPDPSWYIRESLLERVTSDTQVQQLVKGLAARSGSHCGIEKHNVTTETSMSFNYKDKTFIAHYLCMGGISGVDVYGTFDAEFTKVNSFVMGGAAVID